MQDFGAEITAHVKERPVRSSRVTAITDPGDFKQCFESNTVEPDGTTLRKGTKVASELATLDEFMMARCLVLAEQARQAGECAVGCVIVRDGEIVADAREQVNGALDVAGHAEVLALRGACQALGTLDLLGCTLYTNAEPCWMCSFAIRETGVSEVVIRAAVQAIGGATSRFPILSDPDVPGWRLPPVIRWTEFKDRTHAP